jgi:hypothetical protein
MTKKRKIETQLYDHNAASAVHRSLAVTDDGRRCRTSSNQVQLTPVPNTESVPEDLGHFLDDNHIPVNKEDTEALSGVKVKTKRYENSVRQFITVARQTHRRPCLYRIYR